MMARVFLSVLGVNPYEEVEYLPLDDTEPRTPATPFIQEARLEALAARGEAPDRVTIFVTGGASGSRARNWDARATLRLPPPSPPKPPAPDGLAARLARLNENACATDIPDGKSEEELWELFRVIDAAVQEGDELYVDVTHGFRTLPIVLLSALDYVCRAKGAHVREISYGAYEALPRGSSDPRPTFDLTPFFVIRDWTTALVLLEAGDLRALGRHLEPVTRAVQRLLRHEFPAELRRLPKALEGLGDALWVNRLRDLPGLVRSANELANATDDKLRELEHRPGASPDLMRLVGGLGPLRAVLGKLKEKLDELASDPLETRGEGGGLADISVGLASAGFCARHGLFVQATTFLRETMVDLLEHIMATADPDRGTWLRNASNRRWTDQLFGICQVLALGNEVRYSDLEELQHLQKWLVMDPGPFYDGRERALFLSVTNTVITLRNSLLHGGTSTASPSSAILARRLDETLKHLAGLVSARRAASASAPPPSP